MFIKIIFVQNPQLWVEFQGLRPKCSTNRTLGEDRRCFKINAKQCGLASDSTEPESHLMNHHTEVAHAEAIILMKIPT
jgi:hypothetical protein